MMDTSEIPSTSFHAMANHTICSISGESPTAHRQTLFEPDKLRFFQLSEWDEHNSYDEDVPSCLHYSIEWKVTVNNKVVSKVNEQDLVLPPT